MNLWQALGVGLKNAAPAVGPSLVEVIPIFLILVLGSIGLEFLVYLLLHKVLHYKYALPFTLLVPSAVGLLVFLAWPLIFNIIIAFSDWKLSTFLKYKDWGIGNFGTLFTLQYGLNNLQRVFTQPLLNTPSSTFWIVFGRTIAWTVINVFFHVTIGMGIALLLNRKLALKGLYRTLLVVPWAMPMVVAGLVWKGEFHSQFGFVNLLLAKFGIAGPAWLTDAFWAFVAVCIANIWRGIPFMVVIILGGLQSIAGEYYEAAEMDGATWGQQFRNVTLPLLAPVLGPAVTLGTIWTFNNLDVIFLITGGGPSEATNTLVVALYNAAFGFSKFGFAAMFSIVIFVILFLFSAFWLKTSGSLQGVTEA